MPADPVERSTRARAAALAKHALLDPRESTEPWRAGFRARFERKVLAAAEARGERLTPQELAKRTDRLVRSHMLSLNAKRWRKARLAREAAEATRA